MAKPEDLTVRVTYEADEDTITWWVNDVVQSLTRFEIDVENHIVRSRLIELGWTPPDDTSRD